MTNSNLQDLPSQPLLVVAAVARSQGRYLLFRRRLGIERAGEWEFPGGKVNSGESLESALQREIREELRVGCQVGAPLAVGSFSRGKMIAFSVKFDREPQESSDHDLIQWVNGQEILKLPLSFADYEVAVEIFRRTDEIKTLKVKSVLRFFMLGYFAFGAVLSLVAALFSELLPAPFLQNFQWGWGMLLILPLIYMAVGLITGLLVVFTYNLLAAVAGGIEIELARK